MSDNTDDLGNRIAHAAENEDPQVAASAIRGGDFIVFQQIDPESGLAEEDEAGEFSVVLAEIDDDIAVVCFSNEQCAEAFAQELGDDVPEGHDLPAVRMEGSILLDGLPEDCGLLVNPGSSMESYFPPGVFQ